MYIQYLEPICPLFLGLNPSKEGLNSNQNSRGPIWVPDIYIYIYIHIFIAMFLPQGFSFKAWVRTQGLPAYWKYCPCSMGFGTSNFGNDLGAQAKPPCLPEKWNTRNATLLGTK